MHLIILAHRLEGEALVAASPIKPSKFVPFQGLYEGEGFFLLFTGEGLSEALSKTCAVLSAFHVQQIICEEIINLGIAGSLRSTKCALNEIVSIRSVYGEGQFHSFHAQNDGHENSLAPLGSSQLDIISANKRVKDLDYKEKLSSFADLVDRELWGIAYAASLYKIPWRSYKIISDSADESCELALEKASYFSKKLAEVYLSIRDCLNHQVTRPLVKKSEVEVPFFDGKLYFTTSLKQQWSALYLMLIKKYESTLSFELSNFIQNLPETMPKKQKTIELILWGKKRLNPFMANWNAQVENVWRPYLILGHELNYDLTGESSEMKGTFSLKSPKEIKALRESFLQINDEILEKLFSGQFDV